GRSEARADYATQAGASDTLAQDAVALEKAGHHAHAMETWQQVVALREADVDAAKASARGATGKRLAAAKAAMARARKQADVAVEAIIKLWPSVGRIALRVPPGVTV